MATPSLAQAPKRGGVFRVPVPDAPALDPHHTSGFVTQVYASLVWLPMWPRYIAHPSYVKGFRQVDGYSVGSRLLHVWFER